ncbi:DNA-binding response regulator [Candidatus Uhrbacteria bacterium CG10_big_fil_rev_8_21_14_0_10_50_16]|uniref:DNA-binding response regulator n=1 Tax=Candidatus Uhrbacteria bacterium CG10_big_fil_rev_8_21_14_0_10_50_16 TaxID=1975039 RepID=A0A2H0RMU4_9BACT|nr:MAG: DNA-binding response regulator [Candidatus Uhrbacteria bacterium CG10_big_fil_rev_8_21_14_0_10_50_16]
MKLLVVEDEPKLNKGLVTGLQARGYTVESAMDGVEGEQLARVEGYDLIVLDVMLPGRDGLEVCRNLRGYGIQTPILFLTARDTVPDKVAGLDLGGDDYLAKPFAFEELLARVRTLLRRPKQATQDVLVLEDLQVDTRSQKVRIKDKEIDLTLREYGVLEYLLRNKGLVVTREDILSHVWDRFFDSFSNVVDVHVKNLRKKLPKAYAKRIETVWGKGYRIAEPAV